MTLTREEILAMEPGKKLNIAVATNVFNWKLELRSGYVENNWITENGLVDINMWNPSEDISAAWEVAEKFNQFDVMKAKGWEKQYDCRIWVGITGDQWAAQGKTAPEAICKVALLAVLNL